MNATHLKILFCGLSSLSKRSQEAGEERIKLRLERSQAHLRLVLKEHEERSKLLLSTLEERHKRSEEEQDRHFQELFALAEDGNDRITVVEII